jgi:anaerobic selenocysteine-containing dehydrogenase
MELKTDYPLGSHAFSFNEAKAYAQARGERVVPTFCAMCGPTAGCGVYAFVKNGRFTRVAGMAECPINKGGVCVKGQAAPQWVYSPDRLKKPLLRKGAKGEGVFQEIPWDEAIGIIADKLQEQKNNMGLNLLQFSRQRAVHTASSSNAFSSHMAARIMDTAVFARCSVRLHFAIQSAACRNAIIKTAI